jgi:hypothetical protein
MNWMTHDGIMARPWAVDRMISNRIVARTWAVQRAVVMVMVMIVIVSEPGTHITEHEQTYGNYKWPRHRVLSKSERSSMLSACAYLMLLEDVEPAGE